LWRAGSRRARVVCQLKGKPIFARDRFWPIAASTDVCNSPAEIVRRLSGRVNRRLYGRCRPEAVFCRCHKGRRADATETETASIPRRGITSEALRIRSTSKCEFDIRLNFDGGTAIFVFHVFEDGRLWACHL